MTQTDTLFQIVPIIIAVGAVIVLLGFVAVIVLIVRNARKVNRAGYDPTTLQADLAMRVLGSDILTPAQGLEARLGELDALRAKGVISAEEHAAARAEVLSGGR
jgi:hypothetical protein